MQENNASLNCQEFATLVAKSERTIQRYVKLGKLLGVETLQGIRIPRSELSKFSETGLSLDVLSATENDNLPDLAVAGTENFAVTIRQVPTVDDICRQSDVSLRQETTTSDDRKRQKTQIYVSQRQLPTALSPSDNQKRQLATGPDKKRQLATTQSDSKRQVTQLNVRQRQLPTVLSPSDNQKRQLATSSGKMRQ